MDTVSTASEVVSGTLRLVMLPRACCRAAARGISGWLADQAQSAGLPGIGQDLGRTWRTTLAASPPATSGSPSEPIQRGRRSDCHSYPRDQVADPVERP